MPTTLLLGLLIHNFELVFPRLYATACIHHTMSWMLHAIGDWVWSIAISVIERLFWDIVVFLLLLCFSCSCCMQMLLLVYALAVQWLDLDYGRRQFMLLFFTRAVNAFTRLSHVGWASNNLTAAVRVLVWSEDHAIAVCMYPFIFRGLSQRGLARCDLVIVHKICLWANFASRWATGCTVGNHIRALSLLLLHPQITRNFLWLLLFVRT